MVVLYRNVVIKGVVNSIVVFYIVCGSGLIVVIVGVDNLMKVLELCMGFKVFYIICIYCDFIYSLYVVGLLVWSGSGDGLLLVYELFMG